MELLSNDLRSDRVHIVASNDERQELLRFIEASIADIDIHAVNISCHAANRDDLELTHQEISRQAFSADYLELSRENFLRITRCAGVWWDYGFQQTSPSNHAKFPVSITLVTAIRQLRGQYFGESVPSSVVNDL